MSFYSRFTSNDSYTGDNAPVYTGGWGSSNKTPQTAASPSSASPILGTTRSTGSSQQEERDVAMTPDGKSWDSIHKYAQSQGMTGTEAQNWASREFNRLSTAAPNPEADSSTAATPTSPQPTAPAAANRGPSYQTTGALAAASPQTYTTASGATRFKSGRDIALNKAQQSGVDFSALPDITALIKWHTDNGTANPEAMAYRDMAARMGNGMTNEDAVALFAPDDLIPDGAKSMFLTGQDRIDHAQMLYDQRGAGVLGSAYQQHLAVNPNVETVWTEENMQHLANKWHPDVNVRKAAVAALEAQGITNATPLPRGFAAPSFLAGGYNPVTGQMFDGYWGYGSGNSDLGLPTQRPGGDISGGLGQGGLYDYLLNPPDIGNLTGANPGGAYTPGGTTPGGTTPGGTTPGGTTPGGTTPGGTTPGGTTPGGTTPGGTTPGGTTPGGTTPGGYTPIGDPGGVDFNPNIQAEVSTYDPSLRDLQPGDTVEERLANLLASDSRYIEQARQRAREQSNARGLLNSSMAAGAAESAAIEAALPIAQQDAQSSFNQGRANQDAQNNAYQFNADAGNQYGLMRFDNALKTALAGVENYYQTGQMRLENMLQASSELSKQQAGLWAQYLQAAADINMSDMSLENKQAQIAALKQQLVEGINHTTSFWTAAFGNIGLNGSIDDNVRATLPIIDISDAIDNATPAPGGKLPGEDALAHWLQSVDMRAYDAFTASGSTGLARYLQDNYPQLWGLYNIGGSDDLITINDPGFESV